MIRFALVALLCVGCVNTALLDSYRGYHARIGREWMAYVDADPEMTALDKRARRLLHETAGRVSEEAGK